MQINSLSSYKISNSGINRKQAFAGKKANQITLTQQQRNGVYNPICYKILPKQISFGSMEDELKEQKYAIINNNVALMRELQKRNTHPAETVLNMLDGTGINKDAINPVSAAILFAISQNTIKEDIASNFVRILEIDDTIKNNFNQNYDVLDMWEKSFDDYAVGFSTVKKNLLVKYVKPFLNELRGLPAEFPTGVVLYGPKFMVKEIFPQVISQQTASNFEILDTNAGDFVAETEEKLKSAREIFINDKQRTIICVNSIDEIANMDEKNKGIVNYLKSRLDRCSKRPDEHNQGYAATFFFMANDPNKIHKDLREEKIGNFLGVNPSDEGYIKDFFSKLIKQYCLNPNIIDMEEIISLTAPNEKDGAFSLFLLMQIFQVSMNICIQDGRFPFQLYLNEVIKHTPRDISGDEYIKVKNIEKVLDATDRAEDELEKIKNDILNK